MLDNRKKLEEGYELVFDRENLYTIKEEIGRGSSCLIYAASYYDSIGLEHQVRIKECFPYNIDIGRMENGELVVASSFLSQFTQGKDKFYAVYKKNVQIKQLLGLVNSTVDATNIFGKNHTWYMVIGHVEGVDYRRIKDVKIQDIFVRMIALSKIIKKYHNQGYLHLDIKPENMLVIPETLEHVVLFDFDSLLSVEELKLNPNVRISFSDGFAAPELVRGKRNKICEATDIYSIGAVVFFKIFGRKPDSFDTAITTEFDFKKMLYCDERYQPEFYQKLDSFLHKSISSSVFFRYQSMDEVISELEKLVEVSDVNRIFLYHNFSYHSACFVGRQEELDKIGELIEEGTQVLFLSGMGGIGKTELAKKFAFENQRNFGKIVFVSFQESIVDTLCQEEIRINNLQREEKESDEAFFLRKLELLKKLTKPQDLFILDNFDVEYDEHLEELLECPCKFLITTREDFRDYNYEQMEIRQIEDLEEILDLFYEYNQREYRKEEEICIKKILDFIEYHTMTVELIAKYLRITESAPSELFQNFMEKEGITNTKELGIKQRKDKKLRLESINKHLLALFDLSRFTQQERELILSLSLLGEVRIQKALFLENFESSACVDLEKLIHSGWISYEEEGKKIALHQIILDLVYNHLTPTSEKCSHIVEGMTSYLEKKNQNRTERETKKRLACLFANRLRGKDENYAAFLVEYCSKVRKDENALEIAKKIVDTLYTKESWRLRQRICQLRLDLEANKNDVFEMGRDIDEYYQVKADNIIKLAKAAYLYAAEFSDDKGYLGKFYVELAFQIDQVVRSSQMYVGIDEESQAFNEMLAYASRLLEEAEEFIMDSDLESEDKRNLIGKIQSFYEEDDFCAMYRSEHYGSEEKMKHYGRILRIVGEEYEEELYEITYGREAREYLEQGKNAEAIACFEKILELDIKQIEKKEDYWRYSSYICKELLQVLVKNQEQEEAKKYAKEMIFYNEPEKNINWLLVGNYRLYQVEKNPRKREEYWRQCIVYYKNLEEKDEEIFPFLLEYCEKEKMDSREHILILLKIGGKECIEKARQIYEAMSEEDEYLYSLIYRELAEVYQWSEDYETINEYRRKCNYYLIAKQEERKTDVVGCIELWNDAARDYTLLDSYEESEKCYQELSRFEDSMEFETYWSIGLNRLAVLERLKRQQEILDLSRKLYEKAIQAHEKKWFSYKLSELAGRLERVNFVEYAGKLYILAIIVEIEENPEQEILEENCKLERVLSEFTIALHMKMKPAIVDEVLDLWKKMQQIMEKTECFYDFKREFQWFLKNYRNDKIEFRENKSIENKSFVVQ